MNTDKAVEAILERNMRVEAEKAWEVSITRRLFLAIFIYAIAGVLLWMTNQPQFALLSLIPALGYIFSTLSLPWLKKLWLRKYHTPSRYTPHESL